MPRGRDKDGSSRMVDERLDKEEQEQQEEEEEEEKKISINSFASLLLKKFKQNIQGINLLTWCFVSLGIQERSRFHGYNQLDSSDVVDFITGKGSSTSRRRRTRSSSKVGKCPIELKGKLESRINRKNILKIDISKSLIDRQDPLSHGVELFGNVCE